MKKLMLTFTAIVLLMSCNKDDNPQPVSELSKLPPATQTGAQTFACLIDGVAFIPSKLCSNAPRAFYQFINGSYTLGINAATGAGTNLKGLNIGCLDAPLINIGNYTLVEKLSPNYFGQFTIGGGIDLNSTSTIIFPGNLTITRFDPVNFIISGTFSFKAKELNTNKIIEITDGSLI